MSAAACQLRPLNASDSEAWGQLLSSSPDKGGIAAAIRFETDPWAAMAALRPGCAGFVAQESGGALAGSALFESSARQWEGETAPTVLLHTLVVRSNRRGQGIASAINRHRVGHANGLLGDRGVLWGLVQRGNADAEATARKWATWFVRDRAEALPVPMHRGRSAPQMAVTVRMPTDCELDEFCARMNGFFASHNLYTPMNAAEMRTWLDESPFESPMRHCRVAVGPTGRLLAGLTVVENFRVHSVEIPRLAPHLRFFNALTGLVDGNGRMRAVSVSRFWYQPGELSAAKMLLDAIRHEWSDRATAVLLCQDRREELRRIVPWPAKLCRSVCSLAVRAPKDPSDHRLYYFA